jgi:hypothetical protein
MWVRAQPSKGFLNRQLPPYATLGRLKIGGPSYLPPKVKVPGKSPLGLFVKCDQCTNAPKVCFFFSWLATLLMLQLEQS